LALFVQVCHAVQHAHHKGIIHRDIKPSNVLVTVKDSVSIPKVIDFGVAKALDKQLLHQSHQTRFTQMVGTPLYMSPEQASLNGIDVDTRSDVYSLGVLLYELLTGTTPCRHEQLKNAAYSEFRRMKCEEDPQRPSTRVQALSEQLTLIADHRSVDSVKLGSTLRGELDWIVMKALDRDRQHRYQTARSFAADVERYLRNDPVEAGPPSATYRMRKFINRHRGLISAAALVVLALLLGTGVSVWQAVRATNAEKLAKRRLWIANNALQQVREANERSRRNRAQALAANGGFLAAIKNYEAAVRQYRLAIEVDPNSPFANNNYAWFLVTCPDTDYHEPNAAIEMALRATELVPEEGLFWNTLGVSYYRAGSWDKALAALEKSSRYLGDDGLGFNAMFIAMSYWQKGDYEEANCQFDLALQWMQDRKVVDEELVRFCKEAAELLGRDDGAIYHEETEAEISKSKSDAARI
jgi:Tfp pilus assembly protein PilF